MSDIAIQVENLGKQYRIGRRQTRADTLRDQIAAALRDPFRRLRRGASAAGETFWALKDLSFTVRQGEVVGVIGRNGAGKSTLLKVLARITEPTVGAAQIRGRAGTLLEVGTGFHPELTGRENIFLNGAILGMRRAEIQRRFDEIVAFAEIEKFIDTPVKYYSSGMYVRAAFSVAAHLEPEVLLVDEVLAVGDAAFQKKCLGKLDDVAHEGRTVLFVSHNLGQLRRLCRHGLWLHGGQGAYFADVADAIAAYQAKLASAAENASAGSADLAAGFLRWGIAGSAPERKHLLASEAPFTLEVVLQLDRGITNGAHSLILKSGDGDNLGGWQLKGMRLEPGTHRLVYRFPSLPVRPGAYYWYASLWDGARKVDIAHLTPELIVATEDHSDLPEQWAGILNVPCEIEVCSDEQAPGPP